MFTPNKITTFKLFIITSVAVILFCFVLNPGGSPREEGKLVTVGGETFYASGGWGWTKFMTLKDLQKRDFLKGGDAIFVFTMQGGCS